MIAARQIFLGRGGGKLPYDAKVEYLESTGTQFIDTGILSSDGLVISGKCVKGDANSVCGWANNNCITNNVDFRWNGANVFKNITQGTVFSFSWGTDVIVDGVSIGTRSTSPVQAGEIYIFSRGYINDVMKGNIYWIKIENENGLVRDFIPVRFTNELGQREGAMYDRVSGQLFRNQGTGAFLYGADKTDWVNPYVTDGLVAMWDGEWNAGGGVHDANATSWVDLVGSHDQTIYDKGTSSHHWESNHLLCSNHPEETSNTWDNSYTSGEWGSLAQELSGRKTIEIVCDITRFADAYMGRNYFFGNAMIWNNVGYYWVVKSQLSLGSVITDAPFYSAFVFDEDSAYRYYRNGTLATSATLTADPFSGKSSGDTLNLLFATYAVARIRKTYGVRSYNRVLSAAEIAANYAVDKVRFNITES